MTRLLFREDAYQQNCKATVVATNDRGGVITDQTVFYATAGGQPGDKGLMTWAGGEATVATTIYDEQKALVHVLGEGSTRPAVGDEVELHLDWTHRHKVMRSHTMLHLLCAAVPFPVTGSSITEGGGRIDFDIPEGQIPDKAELSAKINGLISAGHPVSARWITDEELDAQPDMVRTMFVKPPRGTGKVRLVEIGEDAKVDRQPCGGTHVKLTSEIGPIAVDKIENKGKINRRIRLILVNP